MQRPAALRRSSIARYAILLLVSSGCGGSPTAPAPVGQTENLTGTLQPQGIDFKPFTIVYTQGTTDLSVTVTTLTTVAASTPVTGITIGVGIGVESGGVCSLQLQNPAATLGQELFAPNGASGGTYCVEIYDCPTGATGCASTLTEPVTYAITVKHF